MNIERREKNGRTVACVYSAVPVVCDVQSALDLLMRVRYEAESTCLCINKEAFCQDFFVLSSGIAGEILQKFVTYQTKLAIYGDYSRYTSKPLRDFIRESNEGKQIFFPQSADEALERLTEADGQT